MNEQIHHLCAPHIQKKLPSETPTCLDINELKHVAQLYNKDHPNNPINGIDSMSVRQLHTAIHEKLYPTCKGDDICMIEQPFIGTSKSQIWKKYKPRIPWGRAGRREWLSSLNIVDVMHQYELAYPNFRFFGPLPRDIFKFEMELPTAIHPNITQFYHEGNKPFDIGMIFNTDCSDQSGSHWTCAFIHVEPNASTVEYFDSVASSSLIRGSRGKCERDQIRRYLEKLTSQLKSIDPNVRFRENDIEHQFKDADCGVYCLNYIISRLEGKSFDQITQTVIRDNEMNILRLIFFSIFAILSP